MKRYNISTNLIRVIKNLYDKATSAVFLNSSIKNDHDMERIMTDALEDHEGAVSIGGWTITNLRFVDDTDCLAGEEEELANLVECLHSLRHGGQCWEDQADDKQHQWH